MLDPDLAPGRLGKSGKLGDHLVALWRTHGDSGSGVRREAWRDLGAVVVVWVAGENCDESRHGRDPVRGLVGWLVGWLFI
jgi:hypothetical protein